MVTWKINGLYKADAEAVYSEITAIGDSFSPEQIVEAARDESTELHKCFTWDNNVAAESWRKHQARMIVTQLVIKTETTDSEPVSVRVIASTSAKNEYKPVVKLIKVEQDYTDLLARAINELKAFQQKYKTITELREIFEAIDEL